MTAHSAEDPEPEPEPDASSAPPVRSRLRWWKEVLYIAAFYGVYSFIRNTQGSATVSAAHAFSHARGVIRIERALGLFFEENLQEAFLGSRWFIRPSRIVFISVPVRWRPASTSSSMN